MNFIKISDESTAKKLINLGFQQISKEGTVYTFLNDSSKQLFEDSKNIVYTNKLNI